jgi:glycosyltransferase involved in cell wall biosynthesis
MTASPFVIVTSSFPIRKDGSEAAGAFVADLAERLAGHMPVRVVAPGISSGREFWCEGVEVFRYAAPEKPLSTLKPWRLRDLLWIVRVWLGGMSATRKAVSGNPFEVLALWALPCGEWARRATKKRGGYAVWMLGSDIWSLGRIPVLKSMLARVVRDAKSAWADGYQLAVDARLIEDRHIGFLPSTRAIGETNVEVPSIRPPYRLLYLGRWHPNKGIDLLLDALEMLDDSDWSKIECVEIHGGGPLVAMVKARVAGLAKRNRPVLFGTFLAKQEAEAAVARADWLLIPSRIESIPVVFSDAVKMRRPVVTMPVGDLPRLIEEFDCGVLASSVDAPAFTRAIRDALAAGPAVFAEGVVRAAAAFSLQSVVEQLLRDRTGGSGHG